MGLYAKAIAALLGGIATWGVTAATDNAISLVEWFGLVGVVGTAIAVFAIPNKPVEEDGHYDAPGVIVTVAIAIIVFLIMWVVLVK
jgi:hypothetical protein